MKTRYVLILLALLAGMATTASAQAPNFGPALFGDGEIWGTKGLGELPPANGRNNRSFDKLFVIVNGAAGQLPVAEAAPGNSAYNGGRWYTHTVMWTADGIANNNPLPVLMSYDAIHYHEAMGDLMIAAGSPMGGPPDFFLCPLLPVK